MPRINKRSLCVKESVLVAKDGGIRTVLLDERYKPYTRQAARIENLCGSFTEYVHSTPLQGALKKQGNQKELFHLRGNVVINQV